MTDARILVLDIETAPLEIYAWGLWDQRTGINMIKRDWSILAYAAKWLGASKMYYGDTQHRADPRDDKELLHKLWMLLDAADIVVTQNGQRFDLPRINARLVQCGFLPPSPYRQVDTKQVAKRYFGFTSRRLEYMGEFVGGAAKSPHKEFPGFDLWLGCLSGEKRAWRAMEKYNKQDVLATEQLYLKMRPWIANHPSITAVTGKAADCPKCGSGPLIARGTMSTTSGQFARFSCKACGGWCRSKQNTLSAGTRKDMVVGS